MDYYIVEKENELAVHGIFDSLLRAKNHLRYVIPKYIQKGYYEDKTLTAESFKILQQKCRR